MPDSSVQNPRIAEGGERLERTYLERSKREIIVIVERTKIEVGKIEKIEGGERASRERINRKIGEG